MTDPVPPTPVYAASGELLDRLGMSEGDDREGALIQCLDASSRWIDEKTGRRFYVPEDDEVRYFTLFAPWNNGGTSIQIDDIVSLTTLQTDNNGDGVHETTWTVGTDYWLGPRNASVKGVPYTTINRTSLTGRFYLPAYEDGIKVTGKFGYSATAPSAIRELTLMLAELLARPVMDLSVAGAQTYKVGVEMSVTMDTKSLPPLASMILSRYSVKGYVV